MFPVRKYLRLQKKFLYPLLQYAQIVTFPQTIDFSSTQKGKKELRIAQKIYGDHTNLTLTAREEISFKKIEKACKNINYFYSKILKRNKIKIGILGLNPHNGENGYIGTEEKKIIIPAIKKLKKNKEKSKPKIDITNLSIADFYGVPFDIQSKRENIDFDFKDYLNETLF